MLRRSGKFYLKNEKQVMESLGLKQTPGSGNGWIIKEDGQNDYVICQLKSTDANSIGVKLLDIRTLEKNAQVSHKLPVFAIQFLKTREVWLMSKPQDYVEVAKFIESGKCNTKDLIGLDLETSEDMVAQQPIRMIKSSESGRQEYNDFMQKQKEENEKKWKQKYK